MRSGHGSPPHWTAALAALVWGVVTLCAAVAVAQPQVACVHPGNPELVTRIRGQTRDLPIRLTYVNAQLGPSPSADALQSLAGQHAAQLIVQVSTLSNGAHAVLVYDAERRVLRRRDVPAPSRKERLSRSATAETIALIVRGELSDALRARAPEPEEPETSSPGPAASSGSGAADAGTSGSSGAATTTPPAAPKHEAPRPSPPPPAAEPDEPHFEGGLPDTGPSWLTPEGFTLGLGARGAYAAEDRWFLAALFHLALRLQRVDLGVSASTSLKDEAQTQDLSVTLHEHTISGELMLRIPLSTRLELSAGPGAGVVVHNRKVETADPSWLLLRNDRTHVSASVGARAQLQIRITQHFGAALRLGVDYMLRPLHFQVAPEANPTDLSVVSTLNAIRPWATLGVIAEL